jgi:hypothetical protein
MDRPPVINPCPSTQDQDEKPPGFDELVFGEEIAEPWQVSDEFNAAAKLFHFPQLRKTVRGMTGIGE